MGPLSLLAGLALLPARAVAADLQVGAGATYPTIAGALAAAADGDRILIAAGVYREPDLVIDGLTLTFVGEPGVELHRTGPRASVFKLSGGASVTLSDLLIHGDGLHQGIRVLDSALVATDVSIQEADAWDGGGIYATNASLALVGGTLSSNSASEGGDLRAEQSTISIEGTTSEGASAVGTASISFEGGSLSLDGVTFRSAASGKHLISASGASVWIEDARLEDNQVTTSLLALYDSPGASVLGGRFVDNQVGGDLLEVIASAPVEVARTLLCGGTHAHTASFTDSVVTFRNNIVLNTDPLQHGLVARGGQVDVYFGHFVSGSAPVGGSAAIHLEGGNLELTDSFVGWQDNTTQGAIWGVVGETDVIHTTFHEVTPSDTSGDTLAEGLTQGDPGFVRPPTGSCDPWYVIPPPDSLLDREQQGAFAGPDPFPTGDGPLDEDGDGHVGFDDCDDGDPTVFAGAPELPCDGLDNDCDPLTPEAVADLDGDGATCDVDCDEADSSVFPGAPERCNGADDDCDGAIDEDPVEGSHQLVDLDEDGFSSPDGPLTCDAIPAVGLDCDDGDAATFPRAPEVPDDGIDQDCDGVDLQTRLGGRVGLACSTTGSAGPWPLLLLLGLRRRQFVT